MLPAICEVTYTCETVTSWPWPISERTNVQSLSSVW